MGRKLVSVLPPKLQEKPATCFCCKGQTLWISPIAPKRKAFIPCQFTPTTDSLKKETKGVLYHRLFIIGKKKDFCKGKILLYKHGSKTMGKSPLNQGDSHP